MDSGGDNHIRLESCLYRFGHLFGNAIFLMSDIGQDGSGCTGLGWISDARPRLSRCDRANMRTFTSPDIDQYVWTDPDGFGLHDIIWFERAYRYALCHQGSPTTSTLSD